MERLIHIGMLDARRQSVVGVAILRSIRMLIGSWWNRSLRHWAEGVNDCCKMRW